VYYLHASCIERISIVTFFVALPVHTVSRPRLPSNGNVRSTLSNGQTIDRFLCGSTTSIRVTTTTNDRHVTDAQDVLMPALVLWLPYTATNHTDSVWTTTPTTTIAVSIGFTITCNLKQSTKGTLLANKMLCDHRPKCIVCPQSIISARACTECRECESRPPFAARSGSTTIRPQSCQFRKAVGQFFGHEGRRPFKRPSTSS
jgi:hypothetical protein